MIIQCLCKCGTEFEEFDAWGRKREYIKGHQSRGKKHSPEAKQLMSENHSDVSGENNPMFGKTHSPETRQLISDAKSGEKHPLFGKHHSPETKQKMSENRPDVSGEKHPLFGKHHSPETKQKMSENHADLSGENNPNWQGGISKEPYCQEWDIWFKEEIKERDDFKCQNPDCKSITNLCVHHIDYDKKNCSTNNLITLCISCNSRANHNREYWKEFYNNILMEMK